MVEVKRFLRGSQMSKELRNSLGKAETIKIAIAFLKEGGYKEVETALKEALKNDKAVEFVVGACPSYHITDTQVLHELKLLEKNYSRFRLGFFHNGGFHPKLFIFKKRNTVRVILGSSNLTSGGTGDNIEANVLIEGAAKEQLIKEILDFFDNEILGTSYKLTDKYIQGYENIQMINGSNAKKTDLPPLPKPPPMKAPKSWIDYPYPYRELSRREKEEIRKRITEIGPDDWETIYCVTLAREYKCSSHQIRGIKARVLHAPSWTRKPRQVLSAEKGKVAILWSTNLGKHIEIYQKQIEEEEATLWGTDYKVNTRQYKFPINGYLYINGDCVRYKATIASIETHRDKQRPNKPDLRPENYRKEPHRTYLKLTEIVPLRPPRPVSYFTKIDGTTAKGGQSMRNYVRVRDPLES
jgi:HKD family nuclease